MKWIGLFCFAWTAWLGKCDACTAFQLSSRDGALLYCRSMEYGAKMDSDLLVVPRGSEFVGSTGGAPGIKWKARFGVVGLNQCFGQKVITDGMNEKGLVVSCLYLPGYTKYEPFDPAKTDSTLAAWEVPVYLLSTCATAAEARSALENTVVAEQKVLGRGDLVLPLHFYICDTAGGCLAVEYIDGARHVNDNNLGVLTNSPPLKWHLANLSNYCNLGSLNAPVIHWDGWTIENFGQGSGLLGLPGDPTPPSRFVRAAFFSRLATMPKTAQDAVRLGFHILNTFDIFPGLIQKRNKTTGEIQPSDTTQWIVVHDRTNLRTYVRGADSLQIQMVDLKKIDFTRKGLQTIAIRKEFAIEDITGHAKNMLLP